MKKTILAFGTLLAATTLLTACSNSSEKDTSSKDTTKTVKVKKTPKYYFKDNKLSIHDYDIEITQTKVIPVGETGNEYGDKPVLAFWYKVTNKVDKGIDPNIAWMGCFEAIQDNDKNKVNKLEVGSLPDERFLESQMEEIKKGGTVENAVAYELDDLTTPVTLKASRGMMGDKLGEQTFNLK